MAIDPEKYLFDGESSLVRVEPTSRFSWEKEPALAVRALSAELHDPLWTLYRQWQVGEFQGEDAAAPSSYEIKGSQKPLTRWWPGERPGSDQASHALQVDSRPAEAAMTGEPFPVDLRTRVELGRLLLNVLKEQVYKSDAAGLQSLTSWLVASAPLDPPAEDGPAARLWRRVHRQIPDVVKLLNDSRFEDNITARLPPIALKAAMESGSGKGPLGDWWEGLERITGLGAGGQTRLSSDGAAAAAGWDVSRLDHRVTVATEGSVERRVLLSADPDADGALDWYAFDAVDNPSTWSGGEALLQRGIPGRVTLPGGPSARWWDFEDSAQSLVTLDLSAGTTEVDAQNHSAGRLVWLDFQLIHGEDWFMAALPTRVGNLINIESVKIKDVFGVEHSIQPADPLHSGNARWSMFRCGSKSADLRTAVIAPTTAVWHESGRPLEQLRFARDEQANLVWAIPQVLPDELGRGRRVDRETFERPEERSIFRSEQHPPRMRYVPQTQVPRGWIPFLPMRIRPGSEQIRFQRAAVAGADGRRYSSKPSPILATPPGEPLFLREESIPRGGVRVHRKPMRARDMNGRVWVWVQRGSEPGTGEVSSGLRFDLAVDDAAANKQQP